MCAESHFAFLGGKDEAYDIIRNLKNDGYHSDSGLGLCWTATRVSVVFVPQDL